MLKLSIDASSSQKVVLRLNNKGYERTLVPGKSQVLITFIQEILNEDSKSVKDLTGIEVMTGPGSFTGLRVGVSVAQALGWALEVPVNGKLFSQLNHIEIKY